MSRHNAYRDGRVYVCSDECSTCVFRRGNLMRLEPGRLKGMISDAVREDSAIICHKTLYTDGQAVCRGFFDRFPTTPLQLAARLGLIEWDDPESQPKENP